MVFMTPIVFQSVSYLAVVASVKPPLSGMLSPSAMSLRDSGPISNVCLFQAIKIYDHRHYHHHHHHHHHHYFYHHYIIWNVLTLRRVCWSYYCYIWSATPLLGELNIHEG
uniref:Uncharacterized protein n=1 Tax=Vespula pensylvanica TaxID=30213 RepID=A0A834JYI1_VESPE|nr:hypothetical protein H0235_016535 [Vespula pensylvanica]